MISISAPGAHGSSQVAALSPDVTLAALRFRKGQRFIYEYGVT